jgi:hypothetical protein
MARLLYQRDHKMHLKRVLFSFLSFCGTFNVWVLAGSFLLPSIKTNSSFQQIFSFLKNALYL